uniref:Uncharacterized protein n=1 Tax=Noctiluca scintillans TaxID=2966 RepID=A0A7S1ANJ8_NOCSC|mmetsp:Transcript_5278/g.15008  ORF Transcript_5278/g.15008 Transcript_5278/m.15008 type:complete len:239 (+) Transcript_5278:46-762(+)
MVWEHGSDPPNVRESNSEPTSSEIVPSVLVFDMGGVLAPDADKSLWLQSFAPEDRQMAEAAYLAAFKQGRVTRGALPQDLWRRALTAAGMPEDSEWRKFDDAVQRGFRPFWEVLGLVDRARRRGYRVGIISNHVCGWFDPWFERFGLGELFTEPALVLVSSRVEVAKPDPAIFDAFLEQSGLQPAQCLFIDDKAANVEAAVRHGMKAVQFRYESKDGRPVDSVAVLSARLAACGVSLA